MNIRSPTILQKQGTRILAHHEDSPGFPKHPVPGLSFLALVDIRRLALIRCLD